MQLPGNLFQNALASLNRRQFAEAAAMFRQVLQSDPKHVPSLNLLTIALVNLEQFHQAEEFVKRAAVLDQTSDATFFNYGFILRRLNRPREALSQFDAALRLNSAVPETWLARGSTLNELQQFQDAIADFDRALLLKPGYVEALCNKGKALNGLRRFRDAVQCYRQALSIRPDLVEARLGHCVNLVETRNYDAAIAEIGATLKLSPDLAEGWLCLGNALFNLDRFQEASRAYDKAIMLRPDLEFVDGMAFIAKLYACDWSDLESRRSRLTEAVRKGERRVKPFEYTVVALSAKDQLDCARLWNRDTDAVLTAQRPAAYNHDRLRVGYVSSDFRTHPTSQLIAGMLECHDRSRFEVVGVSIGPNDQSEWRNRLVNSFERFIDGVDLSDSELAEQIKSAEIDLLIDLNGLTRGARTAIFALRPAPVQVNYLGYPGTMGAAFMDYIIADAVVIPPNHRSFYSEKVVYLPHCYQVNDSRKTIPERTVTRAEASLPDDAIVFCCFNNAFKISPGVFSSWMNILRKVQGSVLWLLEDNPAASASLRSEATSRGVDGSRLVFAPRTGLGEHLARHRLADLFLDTLPYNAHTTASDALWAGLPIVTKIGDTFSGRVAASLLRAIGLPELITHSQDEFEALAIELANDPAKLRSIRSRLSTNRTSSPLFDTEQFTKGMESAYEAMQMRSQAGLPPDHIEISP